LLTSSNWNLGNLEKKEAKKLPFFYARFLIYSKVQIFPELLSVFVSALTDIQRCLNMLKLVEMEEFSSLICTEY